MLKPNRYKPLTLGLFSLLVVIILAISAATSVYAESTTLYLNWSLEGEIGEQVNGLLTLSGYPDAMEANKTYQVEVTLTLESGYNLSLGRLNFKFNFTDINQVEPVGYCYVNSTLNQTDSVTLLSHWTTKGVMVNSTDLRNSTQGFLIVEYADGKGNFVLTPEVVKMNFPIKTTLSIDVQEKAKRGETIVVTGSMGKQFENGTKISIIYLNPNGTEIIRSTSIDADGNFSDTLSPDLEGTWWVKASFEGTQNYASSTSDVKSLEVEPLVPYFLYGTVGAFIFWIIISLSIFKYYPQKHAVYPEPHYKLKNLPTIIVKIPLEKIWSKVEDWEKMLGWQFEMGEVSPPTNSEEKNKVSSFLHLGFKMEGRRAEFDAELTEKIEKTKLTWQIRNWYMTITESITLSRIKSETHLSQVIKCELHHRIIGKLIYRLHFGKVFEELCIRAKTKMDEEVGKQKA